MSSISVIIPVHNGGQAFKLCLESIKRSERRPDELIIVLDGPTPADEAIAKMVDAKILVNNIARGPAVARNQGASVSSSDILLFIDADVELQSSGVTHALNFLERNPDVDAVIGSYDDAPAHQSTVSRYRNLLHHYTHQNSSRLASTFWGACGAIRSSVFSAIGGFSESFSKPSIEDIELGYRLVDAGYIIRLDPSFQVKHLKRWTAADMLRTDVFQRAIPWTDLILQRSRTNHDLNLTGRDRLSGVIVLFVLSVSVIWLLAPLNGPLSNVYFVAILLVGIWFLWLNREFYSLLNRVGGVVFMVASIPWHILFYLYSALSYGYASVRYTARSILGRCL